jgi:hypothetical protein
MDAVTSNARVTVVQRSRRIFPRHSCLSVGMSRSHHLVFLRFVRKRSVVVIAICLWCNRGNRYTLHEPHTTTLRHKPNFARFTFHVSSPLHQLACMSLRHLTLTRSDVRRQNTVRTRRPLLYAALWQCFYQHNDVITTKPLADVGTYPPLWRCCSARGGCTAESTTSLPRGQPTFRTVEAPVTFFLNRWLVVKFCCV